MNSTNSKGGGGGGNFKHHMKTPSSILQSHQKQVLMSDLDGHNSDQAASQYRGLGLRESDFEQHYNNDNHLQYYGRQQENEGQWRQGAMEEETKQIQYTKQASDDDNQERTFMGSVKNERQNEDLRVVASEKKTKHHHSRKDSVQKEDIVAMFDEEAESKPKRKVQKSKMVQDYERQQQQQLLVATTTSDDQESEARRRQSLQHGKKKKKKRAPAYETPVEEEDAPEYNPRVMQDQYVRGGGSYRPQSGMNNFDHFQQNFYPSRPEMGMGPNTGRSQINTMRSKTGFEPQFIKQNPGMMKNRMLMPALPVNQEYPDELEKWVSKPTQQGFLYFHLKGTKTYQWNFPRFYDPEIRKTRPYFVDHWVKKYDNRGKKYWQNMHSKHIQYVKPDSETYLIQASIAGNLAFLEIYIKSQGDLVITDQQRRTALHHSCSNGHREITAMLCEFSYPVLESQDINGCTPVFMATRYNEVECLKLLISYDCNIYQKMRNGDTVLHVAAAYNSLESMIILTNFGGMELFVQKNRYGLRAIEIAQKMRNYECFEVLQKLERNVTYQNALLEREVQALDSIRATKSYRTPGAGATMGYLGSGANYPQMSSRRGPQMMSKRMPNDMIPPLHLGNIKGVQFSNRRPQQAFVNQDDSSILEEQPSGFDLPMEDPDQADDVFESLGGRTGYSSRLKAFDRQAQTQKHERRYLEKLRTEKVSAREDKHERYKRAHDVEFDDYRKGLQEGVLQSQGDLKRRKKGPLNKIQEEEVSGSSESRQRKTVKRGGATVKIQPAAQVESDNPSDQRRPAKKSGQYQRGQEPKNDTYRTARSSGRHQYLEEEEELDHDDLAIKHQDTSQRNQSMFKLSIRDDGSIMHQPGTFLNELTASQSKRGKSATARSNQDRIFNEGSQKYLQRHLAHRYEDGIEEEEDEENLRPSARRPRTSRSQVGGLGDPWKVSRSRERSRGGNNDQEEEDDAPRQSFVELAYDKTSSLVTSVKGLFFTGLTKIKSIIGGREGGRGKSRTSRSQRKSRKPDGSLSSESSMDRYKTPMGRSKSRAFSKVVPIDALEEPTEEEYEERKRQVNFNINRVTGISPEALDDNSRERGSRRAKQSISQRSFNTPKTVQIQAESPQQNSLVKSALKKTPREPSFHSAKSVGVGSHNIHEEYENEQPIIGGASSSNQEQHLQGPALPMQQSINSQPPSIESAKLEARIGIHQTDKKRGLNLKANQLLLLHKAYQSSEERGVLQKGIFRQNTQINGPSGDDQWQQLSASSRNSSPQREQQKVAVDAVTYRTTQFGVDEEMKHMELARQLAASENGASPLAKQRPPESKAPASGTGGVKTTGASTHKKSTSAIGSINTQRRGAPLSQEQFEMIMMNSEHEEGRLKLMDTKQNNSNQRPYPTELKEEDKKNDIQQFYEELMGNNSISIQIATNLPVVSKKDARAQELLEESNLSNLYNRIMSDNQYDIPASKKQPVDTQKQVPSPPAALKDMKKPDPEISLLTEFNPPTQRMGRSLRYDMSFQSGITDIRRALEEEENFENVSNCSFIEDDDQTAAKKINQQIAQSNILDKGQFLASQNSLHQSMGWNAQNNSQIAGRQASAATRPIMGIQMLNQNNSMHFNAGFGNSFRYQSDNEEAAVKASQPLLSRKGSVHDLTPQKKGTIPLSQVGAPSGAPKSAIGLPVGSGGGSSTVNIRASTSLQPGSTGFMQEHHTPGQIAGGPMGSGMSDNTSNSAAVVIQSQNSYNTRQFSTEPHGHPIDTKVEPQHQHMISLFKEDAELAQSSSPSRPQPTNRMIDETQTDLESGFRKTKPQKQPDESANTFQGLSNISEEQKTEQSGEMSTKEIKKAVMKKLIEIMDEDDEDDNIVDDLTIKQSVREEQPSDSDRFIERHAKDDRPQQKILGGAGSRSGSTARKGNTRYGDIEDSMINFDLTSSKIVDHREDVEDDPIRKDREDPAPQMTNRKSLKLQLQEQIQSIVVSESSLSQQNQSIQQQPQKLPGKKTLLADLEAGAMPLVILKPAFEKALQGEAQAHLSGEDSPDLENSSVKPKVGRKYQIRAQADQVKRSKQVVVDTSQDSILNELDSISRIYNEIVPEESKQDGSASQKSKQMPQKLSDSDDKQIQEMQSSSLERPHTLQPLLRRTSETQGDSPVPALWGQNSRKDGSLPPLNRVQSEDEGEGTRRMQDIFYPKEGPDTLRDATPTRRSDHGNQENVGGSAAVGYIQWAREDKQNRSTAAIPIYGAGFSSDEEGGTKNRQNKMARLLSKYQLHQSSVIGNAPLYQQSPSTSKNQGPMQPGPQAVTPFQTQKSVRDVSFKSHNASAHTDNGERLKENLKLFSKNRLLGGKQAKATSAATTNQDQQK